MRILYFVQYFNLPDEPGGSRAYQQALAWTRAGHRVTVIAGNLNDKSRVVAEAFRGRMIAEERVEGIRVLRVWVAPPKRGSHRTRYMNFLSYVATASVAAAFRGGRADLVYASSTPLTAGAPGWLHAATRRVPFVFEVRDLWPESAVVAGVLRRDAPLTRMADRLARFLARRAALTVALTRGIAAGLRAQGVPEEKILFVPNGVDDWMAGSGVLEDAAPAAPEARDRFEVIYCGAHGPWNGLDQVLDAAGLLARGAGRGSAIHFTFVGDGEDRERLMARARAENLATVRFEGALPKQEAFRRIRASSAAVVVTWNHPFQRMVLANKIFDYLAAARPVVVAAEGEMADLVREAGAGLIVPPERPEALAAAIAELAAMNPAERLRLGENGRRHILRHYRREELALGLLAAFERLVPGSAARREELDRGSRPA